MEEHGRPNSSRRGAHHTFYLIRPRTPIVIHQERGTSAASSTTVPEVFSKQYTEKSAVIHTAKYAVSRLDHEPPAGLPDDRRRDAHERLSKHYERITKHNLAYRRYYRQFAY